MKQPLRLALLCLVGGAPSGQTRTPPSFLSGVELITVDTVVPDADGRPVPGLTRDDFVVTEDGRPQAIASFEAFALEPAAVASKHKPVSEPAPARALDSPQEADDIPLTLERDAVAATQANRP